MTREQLDKLCDAPVCLLPDHDGMVIGNSQFLARSLRILLREMDMWRLRPSLGVAPITKTDLRLLAEKVVESA